MVIPPCIQHVCMFIISILLLFHKVGILNTHTHIIYIYMYILRTDTGICSRGTYSQL